MPQKLEGHFYGVFIQPGYSGADRFHHAKEEDVLFRALVGEPAPVAEIAENARGYIALLRDHIDKEDHILYPLAERILPETLRPAMVEAYAEAEARTPGLEEKYRRLVESHEAKLAA